MLTTGEKTVISLSALQIFALGFGLAILHPQVNAASVVCLTLVLAGGITMFREIRALRRLIANDEQRCTGTTVAEPPLQASLDLPPLAQSPSVASTAPARGHDRRLGAIEVGFGDSPAQIARMMVTCSFRQASMKYHPDHGGSNDLMVRIVEARELLLTAFKQY